MAGEDVRLAAVDVDLTYSAVAARVTAAQADCTLDEKAARVTAVEGVYTETLSGSTMPTLGVRVMAIGVDVTRPIHHKSTFTAPIDRTLTYSAPIGKTLTFNAPLDAETLEVIESHPRGGEKEPHQEP